MFRRTLQAMAVVLLGFALGSCAPTPAASDEPTSFVYVQTLTGVEMVARGEAAVITEGFADIIGLGLVLDSPYCVDTCVAGEDWIVEVDLPQGSYGSRVVTPVVAGEVLGGHAVVSLAGAEKSYQSELTLRVRG